MNFKELTVMEGTYLTADVNLLCDISLLLLSKRPVRFGMTQSDNPCVYAGKSSMLFIPMIDLYSSNMFVIFSTLNYLCNQARNFSATPVINSTNLCFRN